MPRLVYGPEEPPSSFPSEVEVEVAGTSPVLAVVLVALEWVSSEVACHLAPPSLFELHLLC